MVQEQDRKPGPRPAYTGDVHRLGIRLNADDAKRLKLLATERDTTVNALINEAIRNMLTGTRNITETIALVRIPAPQPTQLAEMDARIEQGNREGFLKANPDGSPGDERVYVHIPAGEVLPA